MFILRQLALRLMEGEQATPSSRKVLQRSADVLPSTIPIVADGDFKAEQIVLNATDTYAVPLPQNYTNASKLQCFFKTTKLVKFTVVSPDEGTSNYLVKGTDDTTNGEHIGILAFTGTVTSITITVPAASDDVQIDFAMFMLPDLTLGASYRYGAQTTGVEDGT